MNNKENELLRIANNAISCCASKMSESSKPNVTLDEVVGRSRAENIVMTRCILVTQIYNAGYSVTTIAQFVKRSVQAVRYLIDKGYEYRKSSRAYRIAEAEASLLNAEK